MKQENKYSIYIVIYTPFFAVSRLAHTSNEEIAAEISNIHMQSEPIKIDKFNCLITTVIKSTCSERAAENL